MLTDDQVGNGVRAFVNAGKRGADLVGAIHAAITEALATATPQPSGNTGELAPRATADVERESLGFITIGALLTLRDMGNADTYRTVMIRNQANLRANIEIFIAATKPREPST